MTKKNIMPVAVLSAICLVAALLLALVNMLTFERIQKNANNKILESFVEVLPDGKNFEAFEMDDKYPGVIKSAYKADGGFVFQAEVKGYKEGLKILCGISSDGKIVGVKHVESKETFGFESELNKAYIGETLDSAELIIASGATPNSATSKAYFEAIKASLQAFAIAGGANVDIRTPEQILSDNCNAALGTEGVKFTRWFMTEIITGVDAVYESDNGRVYVIGEEFVGVKDEMIVTENASEEAKIAAISADVAVTSSSLTEITAPAGASKNVLKVYTTASGNYVFDMRGAGNGINGDEWTHPSGDYIYLSVSISPDGKIIDVVTTKQTESDGYGNYCASDEYTQQFKGASSADIVITPEGTSSTSTDLGIISGSTITSNGYQKALQQAFKAFDLIKGGTN